MPNEVRVLIFSNHEIAQALTAFRASGTEPLPEGDVKQIGVTDRNFKIQILGTDGKDIVVEISPLKLASSLFSYCKEMGIPLPRKSKKSLEFVDDKVAMRVRITAELKQPEPLFIDC